MFVDLLLYSQITSNLNYKNMKQLILLITLLFVLTTSAFTQGKYRSDSKKAIKLYEKAIENFKARRFDEGVEQLLRAIEVDENFVDAHYRLAATYQLFQEHEEALKYYEKAAEVAGDDAKFKGAYFHLCNYYMESGKYKEAQASGEKFIALKPSSSRHIDIIERQLQNCKFALKAIQDPIDFKSEALPAPLNQFYLQYFPNLTGDQSKIVFTARQTPSGNSRDSDENLYISQQQEGKWTEPQSISENINTATNEGTASISADGKVLVFTACDPRGRVNFGQCDLYISTREGNNWSVPQNLGKQVNSSAWDSQPSLSADGRTLYFISNREKGKGGKDIWFSTRNAQGEWSPAQNLAALNTPYEEASPFIHPNGRTLFFASDGYPGMGSYDLFKSELINQEWTKPENLGYPINTHESQLALFISADGEKGYYSLEELKGGRYIKSEMHVFDVPERIKPKYRSNFVKGYVYDAKTKEKLEAEIELFDLTQDQKQAEVKSDSKTGEYLIVLNQGSEYALEISRKGYAFKSLTFNYRESSKPEPLVINIPLDPISKGTVFRLNNIFFDYNKYELKEKSKAELNELVQFMKENPEVKGEISGHTDNIGDAQANITLSLNRAKYVYTYLIEAGVSKERLSYKGYGASRPDASNDTEEGRAKNRRIEFEIL